MVENDDVKMLLSILDNTCSSQCSGKPMQFPNCAFCQERITLLKAIDAIEKQSKKKPLRYEWSSGQFIDVCPCCHDSWNMDEYGDGMKYCWECGQAINWDNE